MIQRIQTVYLLITTILTSLVIGFPVMEVIGENIFFTMTVGGMYVDKNLVDSIWSLLTLCISSILVALAAISQFKKRKRQIQLCIFNILLLVGFYIVLGVYYWILKDISANEITFGWTVVLPAINIILSYLSIRAIKKDEALVKALDRLR